MASLTDSSNNRGYGIQDSVQQSVVVLPRILRGVLGNMIVEYLGASGEIELLCENEHQAYLHRGNLRLGIKFRSMQFIRE